MKIIVFFLVAFCIQSCSQRADVVQSNSDTLRPLPDSFDRAKFNSFLLPDTAACSWIFKDREPYDSIEFEKVVIRSALDTFIATKKYRKLWTCKLPSRIMIPGDSLIISAVVFKIYSAEQTPGYPATLSVIYYDSTGTGNNSGLKNQ